jgi:heme-degrading monooxygenase HmoA
MIARTWQGVVPQTKAGEYFEYLKKTGLPDYQSTPGNRGMFVFRRTENGETHFLLLTLWEDWESIRLCFKYLLP